MISCAVSDSQTETLLRKDAMKGCDQTALEGTFTIDGSTEPVFPIGTVIEVTKDGKVIISNDILGKVEAEKGIEKFCQVEIGEKEMIYTAGHRGVINIKGCRHRYTNRQGPGKPGKHTIINLDTHIPSPACDKPHGPNSKEAHGPDYKYHLGQAHGGDGNVEN